MILGLLKAEQVDDDKKAFFVQASTRPRMKRRRWLIRSLATRVRWRISCPTRLTASQESISELDASVALASETKQNQHSEFVTLTASITGTNVLILQLV